MTSEYLRVMAWVPGSAGSWLFADDVSDLRGDAELGPAELRPELGRVFGHGKMKTASVGRLSELEAHFKKNPPQSRDLAVFRHLHAVAHTFIHVQHRREEADYDTGKEWTQTDVLAQIDEVGAAFESWMAIREEPVAQAYLVSLLGKRPRPE